MKSKRQIKEKIKELQNEMSGLHYYAGHQFDDVFQARIGMLKWVIGE